MSSFNQSIHLSLGLPLGPDPSIRVFRTDVAIIYIAGSKQTLDVNQLLCQTILSCHNVFSLSSEYPVCMSCIMATYCSGIPFFLNDHQIKFHNLSDSVIYDSLPQLHGVCHQLEKRWDMHDPLLFRKNRRGARSVIFDRLKYRFCDCAPPSH